MKLIITKPTEVDVKYLVVYCGGFLDYHEVEIGGKTYENTESLFVDYPSLCSNDLTRLHNELMLIIDVNNGEVLNWPKNVYCDMHDWKICDEGLYRLLDEDKNVIVEYDGYVPSCMDLSNDGYGDYFEFEIDKGVITGWEFSQDDIDEFCGIERD